MKRWIRQRARWFQGHLQSWSLIGDVLTSLKGKQRIDLFYHLTSPVMLLIVAIFTLSLLLSTIGQLLAIPAGTFEFHAYWIIGYLLAFGPMIMLGLIYAQSEPGLGPLRAVGLSLVYVAYILLWAIAGVRAIKNILLGRRGWAKTERVQEVSNVSVAVEAAGIAGSSDPDAETFAETGK